MQHEKDFLCDPRKKQSYNRALFDRIAREYDRVTPPLSFWNDQRWKRLLIAPLPAFTSPSVIDFACGTGDLTGQLALRYRGGNIIGADLSPRMLELARSRFNTAENIRFIRTDMCASPFPDNAADIVTGGYALRNAPDLGAFLIELYRILKPGGVAAFLDFSHPAPSLFATLQYHLLLVWGSAWGWLLHRDATVYGYIAESLKAFPDRNALARLIGGCGFAQVRTRTFFFGTVAIVSFCKPSA